MPDKVRCADCGFLAARHKDTRQLLDGEPMLRDRGYLPATHYDEHPVCFANKVKFRSPEEMGISTNEDKRKEKLHHPRDCDGFTPWRIGFTPKEHQEMLLSEKAIELQRAEQAADRAWRDAQAERDHQWRLDERNATETLRKDAMRRERFRRLSVALWTLFTTSVGWWLAISLTK